jgi:uncharacterized repeat protein (TIGR01451 family)
MTTFRSRRRAVLALGAVTALIVVPGSPALAGSDHGDSNGKQTICHRNNSDEHAGKPYVVETPDKNGSVSGHDDHTGPIWNPTLKDEHIKWGDIIPPFDYNDNGVVKHFAGLNWTTAGQAWFNNGCNVPITVTVDKTNNANGDATFSDDETATTVGAPVTFKVVVTNTSIVPAVVDSFVDKVEGTPVSITATPDIVGTTLNAGASVTVTFTLAGYTPADKASKVDAVTVVLHEVGDSENTGTATDSSTVRTAVPPPDVSIVKTGPATAVPGDTFTWTLTVRNDGPVVVPTVSVTDVVPTGMTLVSATGTGWTTTSTAPLTLTMSNLAVGGTSTITVVATLAPTFTGTTVSNTAVVAPDDATPADNTSTITTVVTQPTGGGGGGGAATPTPTVTTPAPFTGGGGGAATTGGGGKGLPFTGLPVGFLVAGALALLLSGTALQLLTPRGRHS